MSPEELRAIFQAESTLKLLASSPEEREALADAEATLGLLAAALALPHADRGQIIVPAQATASASMVEQSGEALLIVDEEGEIAAFNDAAQRLFGERRWGAGDNVAVLLTAGDDDAPPVTPGPPGQGPVIAPGVMGRRRGPPLPLMLRTGELFLQGRRCFLLRVEA